MRIWILASVLLAAAIAPGGRLQAPPPAKGARLQDLAWPDAERLLRPDTVVVLPLGAASSEHGPHLKLSHDAILSDYLTRRVVAVADVVAAPALPYHFSPAFAEYPGSSTLTLDTARAMTTEIVRSLARFGPRRFYVLNTGVSTALALEPAARALAMEGILLGYTDLAARLERASASVRQQEGGLHADEIETSMMLYIDPASVDMRRAVKEYTPSRGGPLQLTRSAGSAGTFSASGVWGDPTLATRDKGRVIVESLVTSILDDIEAIRRATPPAPRATGLPPPAPAPRTLGGQGPSESRTCTPGDERTIRDLGYKFSLHWANADAPNLASLWSDDGDLVHPDGMTERGRETIRGNRAALFLRPEYRGSKHPLTLGNVRCLSAEIAVADGKWEMIGVSDSSGKVLPAFEGLCTLVVKRGSAGWLIEAYRYTQKQSSDPMPVLLKRPGFTGGRPF
ncbi:MAG: SgcJ/EcaC family oxidoreductase [Acidobacteriota bacterium]